jgi:hypothetical protein
MGDEKSTAPRPRANTQACAIEHTTHLFLVEFCPHPANHREKFLHILCPHSRPPEQIIMLANTATEVNGKLTVQKTKSTPCPSKLIVQTNYALAAVTAVVSWLSSVT